MVADKSVHCKKRRKAYRSFISFMNSLRNIFQSKILFFFFVSLKIFVWVIVDSPL